jgi:F-type H+-transporting ATPase subunit b
MSGLGLNLQQVLLHIANMAILFFVVWKLLYKPISRFMKKRSDEISRQIEEAAKKETEAEQLRAKYDEMVRNAQALAAQLIDKSKAAADEQARQIVQAAQANASDIIVRSRKDVQLLKSKAKDEMRSEITDMAIQIAQKILRREVQPEDNREIINSFFSGKEI